MSNFWFDENAFRLENSQGNEGDFADDIFDELPARPSIQPTLTSLQHQQMSPQQQNNSPYQQSLKQQQQPVSSMQASEPQIDTMFNDPEFSQFGGDSRQKHVPQTVYLGKSPQMFMRQSENMGQFSGQSPHMSLQNASPQIQQQQQQQHQQQHQQQQQQQQAILDQSKQEQLLKMRQQLMHQQMLQRPKNQGGERPVQQQQKPNNFGQFNSGMAEGPGNLSQSATRMAQQNFQQMSQAGNSKELPASPSVNAQFTAPLKAGSMEPVPLPSGGSRPMNTNNQGLLGPQGGNGKPSPAQIAQLQHELFQMTLSDFMNRRGTPITQTPVINNKRINLFVLDILGRRIGGPQNVLKHIQMLSQPSTQITEWSSICQKLGLFEGIDAQNNVNARQQIEKQLGSCYLQYILPYEQYCLTEEGQKDINSRRLQFQRQLLMRLQQQQQRPPQAQQQDGKQQQQQQQQTQQAHTPQFEHQQRAQQQWQQQQQDMRLAQAQNSLQAQQQTKGQLPKARMLQVGDNISNAAQAQTQFRSPSIPSQSPHHGMIPTPNMANMPSPSASVVNSQRKLSQQSTSNNTPQSNIQSPHMQQIHPSRSNSVQRRQSSIVGHALSQKPETPLPTVAQEQNGHSQEKPNTVKKYVPIKKESNLYGDWILKSISDLGDEIELTKPVYLFAPELGSLNIHALVMSLKNYTRNNPGEASSALNTLLVTTTDPNFAFNLNDAPELLDALVGLGLKILDQITAPNETSLDYVDIQKPSNNNIDSIFSKFVNKDGMNGEDIVYVVDSLTGEVIEDEDSDIDIDDVFSPKPIQERDEECEDGSTEFKQCSLPDFMTALQNFKSENKYHFSKAQTKGALNDLIFLVDNLITITMTLRNLSFTEQSSRCMSNNLSFKKLLFRIVKEVATKPEVFVLQRKKLCLLKDCLLMLDRNAHYLEIDSLEEAFFTFLLVSSFGPALSQNENDSEQRFKIPSAPFEIYSYLPFGIDVFTKLFVREPKNRAYFQAVLSGTLNVSAIHLNSGNVVVKPEDHQQVKRLLNTHLKSDESGARSGILLTRAFKLLMSAIPFTMSGAEYTKFILQRSSTVLQALFGSKLLIDLMVSEDINGPFNMLLCHWLTSNTQYLLFNFTRNTIFSIMESVKFEPNSSEFRALSYIGLKSMILVNSLLANVVSLKRAYQENELENRREFEVCFEQLQNLYRVQLDTEFVINTLLTPRVDSDVSLEVLRFRFLMENLG